MLLSTPPLITNRHRPPHPYQQHPPMQRLFLKVLASSPSPSSSSSSSLSSFRWLSFAGSLRSSPLHTLRSTSPYRRLAHKKHTVKAHKNFKGTSKATKKLTEPSIFNDEHHLSNIMWWKEKMKTYRKLSSLQLISRLKYSNLLGLDQTLKNGSLKEGTLNMELLQFKARFPREVLLCRVGDFYEAVGFDACVLVEHAGLNPCGGLRSDSIPKAGCPAVNLRQTLNDLTSCGYSVCVVEEVQGPAQARSRKGRFISGHAHPGSPYVFGLAEADHDVDFPEPMPVIGISRSAKGYCVISVLETMKTFSEEDGLTEEAIVTKLRSSRCHHLFLHTSLRQNPSGTCRWGEFGEGGLLWSECNGMAFEWFDGDPIEELFCKVRDIYGLDQEAKFRNIKIYSEKHPQPLFLGTATQIGVIPTEGIPSLLKVLLPPHCVGLPTLYVRDLLLNPPPYSIACAIQETCKRMENLTCSVPEFTCISAPKLVKLLESKEVNHIEFRRIKNVADQILHMCKTCELCPILQSLMVPTWLATGLRIELQILVTECEYISHKIGKIMFLDGETDQEISSFEYIAREFFDDMESSWKGRVKRIHAEEAFAAAEEAAKAFSKAIMEDFVPIITRVKSIVSPLSAPKVEISYAREHGAIWFKGKRFMPNVWANTPGEEQIKRLRPASDSKGRKVGEEWFTTPNVEDALNRYIEATSNARSKVMEVLRALSDEFQSKINVIVFSSTLHIIAKALFSHVSEGRRRKWVFPELVELTKAEDNHSPELAKKLELVELSPYWFDNVQGSAISNNITMKSLFILTGPNGGGKSSLLRSVCAASLLGICGLMVPAEKAFIPHFDAIMLHMKSYDSPSDGKSSFQIEMSEMRSILSAATPRSLVLLDEICRGTETAKGTCIAGSIVETLDGLGSLGIVSTHLHGIFDLPLVTKTTTHKAMGTVVVDECVKPTWKLLDGICRESLAFETAQNEGIPEKIISRAREMYRAIVAKDKFNEMKGKQLSYLTPDSLSSFSPAFTSLTNSDDLWPSAKEMLLPMSSLQKEVENAVTITCQKKLIELYKKRCTPELIEVTCVTVLAGEQPPPSTIGSSSVYVLLRPDKRLYIGQSDDLAGRIRAHRSKEGLKNSAFLYVIVPGKSVSSQLETLLINQLPLLGFRLANKADGKHRNFGTSNLSGRSNSPAIHLLTGD